MNVDCPDVNLGKTLTEFKEFSADFDPTMKGLAMSNSEELRATHNSFARQSVFEFDAKFAKEDDDVFHFGKSHEHNIFHRAGAKFGLAAVNATCTHCPFG